MLVHPLLREVLQANALGFAWHYKGLSQNSHFATAPYSVSKNSLLVLASREFFGIIEKKEQGKSGEEKMEGKQADGRKAAMVVDIDMLMPKGHLLWKVDKAMDYDWPHERLGPY